MARYTSKVMGLQGGGKIVISAEANAAMQRLEAQRMYLSDPAPLLKTWGRIVRQDFRRQFATGGDPKWKGLAASTIAAKLIQGVPTRNKNGNIQRRLMQNGTLSAGSVLIAKGNLRDSYSVLRDPYHVEVIDALHMTLDEGSRDPVAVFHQYGTKAYTISPKSGKTLAFIGAGGKRVVTDKPVKHPGLAKRPVRITERAQAEMVQASTEHIRGESKDNGRTDE